MKLPFDQRRPDAYRTFVQNAVTRCRERGREGLLNVRLPRRCPEVHFQDFVDCLKCWLKQAQGESGPYHLHEVDLSANQLSNAALKTLMREMKDMELRIDYLNLSGNMFSDLHPLVDFLWEGEHPMQALSLRDNRLDVEDVNALIRCVYNHENYPEKSKNGRLYLPFRVELSGNPCCRSKGAKLSELLNDIVRKCGQERMFIGVGDIVSADETKSRLSIKNAEDEESLLYIALHIPFACPDWKPVDMEPAVPRAERKEREREKDREREREKPRRGDSRRREREPRRDERRRR